jgi:nucleoside-diphosphate-sugar epimerase
MAQLAESVVQISKELFGYTGKFVCQQSKEKEYLTDNPNRRCPNILKAHKELDYNPLIMLEEGLRRSLIWYSENLEAEEA